MNIQAQETENLLYCLIANDDVIIGNTLNIINIRLEPAGIKLEIGLFINQPMLLWLISVIDYQCQVNIFAIY